MSNHLFSMKMKMQTAARNGFVIHKTDAATCVSLDRTTNAMESNVEWWFTSFLQIVLCVEYVVLIQSLFLVQRQCLSWPHTKESSASAVIDLVKQLPKHLKT